MIVYLCGPINGCSDADARDWREWAKAHLKTDTLDPMDRDYRGREAEVGAVIEIVENDKMDIEQSDCVLLYYERPSVGTSMEVLYAWMKGRAVVLVDKSDKPLSPWLKYHSNIIFSSLKEAVDHINQALARG